MDIQSFTANNTRNYTTGSSVTKCMKTEECWVGIDEAGRGPVLGPMVYGICYSPLANKNVLKSMGFADSKSLSKEQRDAMFDDIAAHPDKIGWMIEILSPHYISTCMLRRMKYNLNQLSHDTAIGLLRSVLDQGVNVKKVYIDTVGDPEKYQNKLKELFPDLEITVAKKADATYSIVSAASICAKVSRDKAVKDWIFSEELDCDEYGSGYPGDPKTKDFISRHVNNVFGFPKFVRFSWSTASKMLEEKAVRVHWIDDEDENVKLKKRKSIVSFFSEEPKAPTSSKSFKYYVERDLQNCTHL